MPTSQPDAKSPQSGEEKSRGSEEAASPPTPKPQTPAAPIGHLAIRGMIWQMGQVLGGKAVTVIQQLLIAKYFLDDEDFGLLAVSQVVVSIASLGQSLGVGEILVRRHRRFNKWVDAGFWLNLTGGTTGMALVLGLIPIWEPVFLGVARLFGGHVTEVPAIGGLLAVWAVWLPLDSMTQIFYARLRSDMRFHVLAILGFVQVTGLAILSLTLAWLGLRAYSLVIPIPILSLCIMGSAWLTSRQQIRWHANLRRWRLILKDSRFFLLGNVFNVLFQQGDYMLTSVFFSRALLGAYYYAYRMSTQTVQLVSGNILSITLASFSKIDRDEARRTIAYQRTCTTLLLVGMPLCFLQALLAEPVFHLLFNQKWDEALPLFRILSIGMGFTLPMATATGLLLAQGRYRLNVTWQGVVAGGFLFSVLMGALGGTILYVAYAVCIYFIIVGPITTVLPVRHARVVPFVWRVYGFSLLASSAAAGTAWAISYAAPWDGLVTNIALRSVSYLATFSCIVWVVKPQEATELVARLRGLWTARRSS